MWKILLTMKAKRFQKKNALHNRGRFVFIHEMFWFMPISLWIVLNSQKLERQLDLTVCHSYSHDKETSATAVARVK